MPLTATLIRNVKPQAKPQKLFDGRGLFLLVSPKGGKWWRFKYRIEGKEKLISLGTYPDVSLKEAREQRDKVRKMVAKGIDPSSARKAEQAVEKDTFEAIALEWLDKQTSIWVPSHAQRQIRRLEQHVLPYLGDIPIKDITPPTLLAVLRRIEDKGVIETAHRVHQLCGQIFRYAVATGRAERDPSGDLRGALAPAKGEHFATMTDPREVAALLRAMDGFSGQPATRCALRLAPLVFVRPGELRSAEWSEIDLDKAEWRIPAAKMKMRQMHIVPLSRQAIAILKEIHPLTGNGKYVFPGLRSASRPMSNNTINAALRRLGYSGDEMTGHGFRSMASTILNEQGWPPDVIERQLAHAERNKVRAAYNHAEHLPQRRKMMQSWADYLDGLKAGAKVTPIRRERLDG
ncbi:tyrosine-type recombinase/integrase [Desulfocurvus sp. DL9XJH121]